MARLLLRKEVPDDLSQIFTYIAERNLSAAKKFLSAAQQSMQEIARQASMGSPKTFHSRRLRNVRSWNVKGFRNHLILYEPVQGGIRVLAVVHGARRLSTILSDRT